MPSAPLNGTELYYEETGDGPPCFVMHGGLGLDLTSMHPSLDPLADTFQLVYYDHRGNGRSGRPPIHTLFFEKFADDADALRAHLGLGRIAVLGHSYGSFIALEYALRYPSRLSHLILVGAAPAFDYGPDILHNATRRGATPRQLTALGATPADDTAFAEQWRTILPLYFHHYDPEVVEPLFQATRYSAAAAVRGNELLRHYNLLLRLSELHAPALILAGRDDFITPPHQAERLAATLPQARLIFFERSGQYPWIEEPDQFFSIVRGWLAETQA